MTEPNSSPRILSINTFNLDELEQMVARSQTFAWGLIVGVPALGIGLTLLFGLPLFAALMSGCFLLATTAVSAKAIATFTGKALQLMVSARLVLVMTLGALLFCATGNAWNGVISATLLWLVADRVLGRRALYDLWKLTRKNVTDFERRP